jgi:hypothetical protein
VGVSGSVLLLLVIEALEEGIKVGDEAVVLGV